MWPTTNNQFALEAVVNELLLPALPQCSVHHKGLHDRKETDRGERSVTPPDRRGRSQERGAQAGQAGVRATGGEWPTLRGS